MSIIYNDTINSIFGRRSCHAFSDRKITDDEVETIYRAGCYAPNSGGRQPWHFTFIRDEGWLDDLGRWVGIAHDTVFLEKNPYAKDVVPGVPVDSHDGRAPKIIPKGVKPMLSGSEPKDYRHNAPLIVIVSGNPKLSPNCFYDGILATENMYIAAESLGIKSLFWGIGLKDAVNLPEAKEKLKDVIPEDFRIISVSLFGYPADDFDERSAARAVGFVRGEGRLTLL
jgi:nitroreductase